MCAYNIVVLTYFVLFNSQATAFKGLEEGMYKYLFLGQLPRIGRVNPGTNWKDEATGRDLLLYHWNSVGECCQVS